MWALSFVPLAFLEALRWVGGSAFSAAGMIARWALVMGVLSVARIGALHKPGQPWRGLAILAVVAVAVLGYVLSQATESAWLVLSGLYALFLILAKGVSRLATQARHRWPRLLCRLTVLVVMSAAGGLVPVVIGQIEARFSDEEFFVLVQALGLTVFFGLVLTLHLWLSAAEEKPQRVTRQGDLCLKVLSVLSGLFVLAAIGGWVTVRSYQASFFPPQAPPFEGISAAAPFLCGETDSPAEDGSDGEAVFQRLLARIEANPRKIPPDFAMLALATGDRQWAEDFRQAILTEARDSLFAGPAHSVKSTQYEAALRLYYLWKVEEAFPDLFTRADQSLLRDWFAAINARALTVEWVDWMYALAFSKWPEGPYENQENGAGLLALLEACGYATPELSAANRDYLARNERGWQERFRNTDDAYVYQMEWLNNALFQSLYTGRTSERNLQLSFDWLLLQSLPDGAMLRYNHPARLPVAGMTYLGALLLDDPRLLWMAGRSVTQVETEGQHLRAQPGLEAAVAFAGQPPTEASCLLYGDSGLPNQGGPLAPDKIVFRDGWSSDSAYAMLNLRFTGWHRYKASNTLTLLYQDGPLVVERTLGQPFAWLPEGRSLFRDKRIPRENLNGLLIERTGMSAVLYGLTGIGGPWAQDPPFYARVERFETLGSLDVSRTVVDDWHGWQHARTIYFFHGGPVIVVDKATSHSRSRSAAVSWHLVGEGWREGESLWLRQGERAARVAWTAEDWSSVTLQRDATALPDQPNLHVVYHSPRPGHLDLATTWLIGRWADGQYQATTLLEPGSSVVVGHRLTLSGPAGTLEMLHNATSERLEAEGLATNGEAVVVWGTPQNETTVCALGSTFAEITLADQPGQVMTLEDQTLSPGEAWQWRGGRLIIRDMGDSWCVKTR
jgi:hypothetical protein